MADQLDLFGEAQTAITREEPAILRCTHSDPDMRAAGEPEDRIPLGLSYGTGAYGETTPAEIERLRELERIAAKTGANALAGHFRSEANEIVRAIAEATIGDLIGLPLDELRAKRDAASRQLLSARSAGEDDWPALKELARLQKAIHFAGGHSD